MTIRLFNIPYYHVESFESTMKTVGNIIDWQLVGFSVQSEFSFPDSVTISSDSGSQKPFTFVVEVFVHMVVSEDNILKMTIFIRGPELNDSSSEIGNGNLDSVFVSQKLEIGLFPVDYLLKVGSFQL